MTEQAEAGIQPSGTVDGLMHGTQTLGPEIFRRHGDDHKVGRDRRRKS